MVNNTDKQQNRTKVEDLVRVKGICQYANPPKMGSTGNYQPAHLILVDGDKRHDVQDFPVTTEGEFTYRVFPSPLEDCRGRYFEFMVAPDAKTPSYASKSGTTYKWMAKNLINDPFEQEEDAIEEAIEAPEDASDPEPVVNQEIAVEYAGIDPNQLRIMRQSTLGYAATLLATKDFDEGKELVTAVINVARLFLDYVITGCKPNFDTEVEDTEVVEDDDVIETLSAEEDE